MLLRVLSIGSALFLIGFFLWPWISQISMSDDISIHAGGVTAKIPMVMGLFGTLGLAAMLLATKR